MEERPWIGVCIGPSATLGFSEQFRELVSQTADSATTIAGGLVFKRSDTSTLIYVLVRARVV